MSIMWAKVQNREGKFLNVHPLTGEITWGHNIANGTLLKDHEAQEWIAAGFTPILVGLNPGSPVNIIEHNKVNNSELFELLHNRPIALLT